MVLKRVRKTSYKQVYPVLIYMLMLIIFACILRNINVKLLILLLLVREQRVYSSRLKQANC